MKRKKNIPCTFSRHYLHVYTIHSLSCIYVYRSGKFSIHAKNRSRWNKLSKCKKKFHQKPFGNVSFRKLKCTDICMHSFNSELSIPNWKNVNKQTYLSSVYQCNKLQWTVLHRYLHFQFSVLFCLRRNWMKVNVCARAFTLLLVM